MPIGQGDFLADGQVRALCAQCGAEKHEPFDRCETCAFAPRGEDLIKATVLSVYRYADQPSEAGRYAYELATYRGKNVGKLLDGIDIEEVERLRRWLDQATQTPPHAPAVALILRAIWPVFVVVTLVGVLIAYLKH